MRAVMGSLIANGLITIIKFWAAVERFRRAILEHKNVVEVVELLKMHMAPKQILINAQINLRSA